ncbi:MAG: hypothetical protein HUK05_08415 [Prevotella sp.]|nr:hypothetical protein [Prevotella sp.]MCF0208638.1 hypothetical protein [Bacteroidaceae bacterium]
MKKKYYICPKVKAHKLSTENPILGLSQATVGKRGQYTPNIPGDPYTGVDSYTAVNNPDIEFN